MLRTERRYAKQTRDAVRRQNKQLPPEPADYVKAVTIVLAVLVVAIIAAIVFWKVALVIGALGVVLFLVTRKPRVQS